MTGNTTTLGIAAGRGNADALVPLAVAVTVFVIAIAAATAALELGARRGRPSTAAAALVAEAVLIAVFMLDGRRLVRDGTVPGHSVGGFYVLLAIAVVAMGIQTASLTRALGRTLRTTFVSGMLTSFIQELVNVVAPPARAQPSFLRDELGLGGRRESLAQVGLHLGVWASFLAGAVWGGFGVHRWTTWALVAPIGALLAAAAVDLRRPLHRVGAQESPR